MSTPTREEVLAGRVSKPYFLGKSQSWPIGSGSIKYWLEVYTQPKKDRAKAWVYHRVWEHYTWRVLRRLEPFFRAMHESRCSDEWCSYVPLTNRQDLRCHDLHDANRTLVTQYEVSETEYEEVRR